MRKSAGILAYQLKPDLQVFLVHPGGPFYKNKDLGAWTIPKGEINENENFLEAARREFFEETGITVSGRFIELKPIKQKSGKMVYSWAIETELDPQNIVSNTFEVEWPPKSGKLQQFPEVDKAAWLTLEEARMKILPAQVALLEDYKK
jgi:predicted NUDIX family NTP pyrophosphohydrolase